MKTNFEEDVDRVVTHVFSSAAGDFFWAFVFSGSASLLPTLNAKTVSNDSSLNVYLFYVGLKQFNCITQFILKQTNNQKSGTKLQIFHSSPKGDDKNHQIGLLL
jgi:hypothetical protein